MLDANTLEMLVCPSCQGKLTYTVNEQKRDEGELTCQSCHLVYAVVEDIPILIVDQANAPDTDDGDEEE